MTCLHPVYSHPSILNLLIQGLHCFGKKTPKNQNQKPQTNKKTKNQHPTKKREEIPVEVTLTVKTKQPQLLMLRNM